MTYHIPNISRILKFKISFCFCILAVLFFVQIGRDSNVLTIDYNPPPKGKCGDQLDCKLHQQWKSFGSNVLDNRSYCINSNLTEVFNIQKNKTILTNKRGTKDGRNRIVIIGAGPTALGAAQRLYELYKRRDIITTVTIIEQQAKPGGLASSERDEHGFLWDMGGHVVFSHYDYFTKTLDRVVPHWNRRVRAAYAYMKGADGHRRFISYPVQNNIEVMDKVHQEKCLSGLEKVSREVNKTTPANFDEWLIQKFGLGLNDVFMRKYNKKVWTVDTTEMNSVWVGERVAVPDLEKIRNRIAEFDDGNTVKTLAWGPNNFFRYPSVNGTGNIWQGVADSLPSGWFRFHTKVLEVNFDSKFVTVSKSNDEKAKCDVIAFDTLISTVPLDMLTNILKGRDTLLYKIKGMASQLVYSHTHIVGIGLRGNTLKTLADKSWMYFPDSDSPFYRVTVFSNYSRDHVPQQGKYWSLMCESAEPMNNSDIVYWSESNIVKETINALVEYGFINTDMIISKYHRRLHHGYPVPTINRDKILDTIQPWLLSKDIYSRGRFGGWRYEVGNQDHSFMQGIEVIDKIIMNTMEDTYPNPNYVNSRINSGRFLDNNFEYEFVIAHYDENLDWIKPIANHSHVYHKGNKTNGPPFPVYKWEILPNYGRESNTYLHHIIQNYNTLSNLTIFLQGHLSDHLMCYQNPMDYVKNAKINIYCKTKQDYNNWGKVDHILKWKIEYESGIMRRSNKTVGEFYKAVLQESPPPSVPACFAGCFSATKENIRRRPIGVYKRALDHFNDHYNPEEGHYMERLWCRIVNC